MVREYMKERKLDEMNVWFQAWFDEHECPVLAILDNLDVMSNDR